MKWRIYYEDGSTWNWTQGLRDAPSWGVMCVLQIIRQENGVDRYHIVYGCQYYMRSQDQWLHAYENDVVDFIIHEKPIDKLLVGRMTTKKIFGEVYEQAKADKAAENL